MQFWETYSREYQPQQDFQDSRKLGLSFLARMCYNPMMSISVLLPAASFESFMTGRRYLVDKNHRWEGFSRWGRLVLKVTALTLLTVMLMGIIGGFVFVNILAKHLQENILPFAQMDLGSYNPDRTSCIYY